MWRERETTAKAGGRTPTHTVHTNIQTTTFHSRRKGRHPLPHRVLASWVLFFAIQLGLAEHKNDGAGGAAAVAVSGAQGPHPGGGRLDHAGGNGGHDGGGIGAQESP